MNGIEQPDYRDLKNDSLNWKCEDAGRGSTRVLMYHTSYVQEISEPFEHKKNIYVLPDTDWSSTTSERKTLKK